MYLFNLKSILWNFLKLCLIIIQLHHYIIIIRLREEKKKRKKKIAFHFLVTFFQYHPTNVQSRWNSMETCSQVASRRPVNRLHSRRFLVSRTFSFPTPPRFNPLSRITVKLFPCVAPCREHMISTWRFDEIDQVIPRFIGERSAKIKMIMHDAHTIWLQISLHNIFILILYALLLCIPLFFFYFFILN